MCWPDQLPTQSGTTETVHSEFVPTNVSSGFAPASVSNDVAAYRSRRCNGCTSFRSPDMHHSHRRRAEPHNAGGRSNAKASPGNHTSTTSWDPNSSAARGFVTPDRRRRMHQGEGPTVPFLIRSLRSATRVAACGVAEVHGRRDVEVILVGVVEAPSCGHVI